MGMLLALIHVIDSIAVGYSLGTVLSRLIFLLILIFIYAFGFKSKRFFTIVGYIIMSLYHGMYLFQDEIDSGRAVRYFIVGSLASMLLTVLA